MDSLTEWYRYIDQVSRPARRLSEDDDEELEQWRPWKPTEEASLVEEAIPAEAIPDLSAALGLTASQEARHLATVEYVDPTIHDRLEPIPTFSATYLRAPSFEISIPRYGERVAPVVASNEVSAGPAREVDPRTSLEHDPEPDDFEARLARVFAPGAEADSHLASSELAETEDVDEAEDGGSKGQGFRHWDLLSQFRSHDVAQNSYKSTFRETREELVQRLLDPPLTLEETARLLGVCPTTVRRYTNKGQLSHFRTTGNQRRFRLSDVLEFLESRGTEIEADARADREAGLET